MRLYGAELAPIHSLSMKEQFSLVCRDIAAGSMSYSNLKGDGPVILLSFLVAFFS